MRLDLKCAGELSICSAMELCKPDQLNSNAVEIRDQLRGMHVGMLGDLLAVCFADAPEAQRIRLPIGSALLHAHVDRSMSPYIKVPPATSGDAAGHFNDVAIVIKMTFQAGLAAEQERILERHESSRPDYALFDGHHIPSKIDGSPAS